MDGIYERLAARLDEFPHGFSRTASGVELRILEKIFICDDAALATQMRLLPETVEAAAQRLSHPVEELRLRLDGLMLGTLRQRLTARATSGRKQGSA